MTKQYVIRFANELNDFRLMEFESLASLYKLSYKYIEPITEKPFMIIETNESDKLDRIFNRIILATDLFELWSSSSQSIENFFNNLNICNEIYINNFYENCSFRIQIETFGKKLKQSEKIERIERLSCLKLMGKICMNNPDIILYYMEYYGLNPNQQPKEPYNILFGKWIRQSNRKFILNEFSIKNRKFIANTTMNVTLSFLMSNIALVNNNNIVYDPFVGSGSLLISSAYYGSYVCGTDIDYKLLHCLIKPSKIGVDKRMVDETIYNNLKQYNLHSKYIDVIIGDSSLSLIRENFQFDAIITDPPYGIRESCQRIGTKKTLFDDNYKIPEEYLDKHYPAKLTYNTMDIYNDLLNFSTKNLKINGILIFWVPYNYKKYNNNDNNQLQIDDCFKNHSNLKLLSYGEQKLTKNSSRILMVMKRIS